MPIIEELDQRFTYPKPRSKIDALERQLSQSANNWYLTEEAKYVKEYHDIYHELCSIGWIGGIDLDAELPIELMPKHWLNRVHSSQKD